MQSKRKLILRSHLSPGDIVMLTAAVRDIHRLHPETFITDVRTACPDLWEGNPHITELNETDPEVEVINCHYPLIHRSNQEPWHFLHGFHAYLQGILKVPLRPTEFKGDVYIEDKEKEWISQVHEITGEDTPFWIIVGGGKMDYTIKWWSPERFQEVVDRLKGKVQFVQVGESGHHHPKLTNVIDLVGKTSLRQLVRLVFHSQGVLCPVTMLMHLAAAVPVRPGRRKNRPCVVVAGGREPPHWEAYPNHQFIHTVGTLSCCDNGGCWKSRTVPVGDGDEKDLEENLCVEPVGELPRCMDMITSEHVVDRIGWYLNGS